MNIGPMEVIIIFVVALLVFGPAKLPEIGRQVGKAVREFRKFQSSFQNEFQDFLEEPPPGPIVPQATPEVPTSGTSSDGATTESAAAAPAAPAAPAPGPGGPTASAPAVPLRPVTSDEAPPSGNGDGVVGPPAEA
ncbi:MAG: Sec-independent protein translocase subunit TatA/TatB [Acidimicrobiia bacterium]